MPSACLVVENKATYWTMYNVDEWALRLSYLHAEKWPVFNHGTGRLWFMKQPKLKKCKHKSLLGDRWISLRFADDIPHISSNETFRLFIDWDSHESVKQYREIRCSLYSQGICVNQFVLWLKCKSMSRAISSNDWTFHSGFLQGPYSHIQSCTRPA